MLLASLREGANQGSTVQNGPADVTEIRSTGAKDPAGGEVESSRVNDPAVDDLEIGKPDACTNDTKI